MHLSEDREGERRGREGEREGVRSLRFVCGVFCLYYLSKRVVDVCEERLYVRERERGRDGGSVCIMCLNV